MFRIPSITIAKEVVARREIRTGFCGMRPLFLNDIFMNLLYLRLYVGVRAPLFYSTPQYCLLNFKEESERLLMHGYVRSCLTRSIQKITCRSFENSFSSCVQNPLLLKSYPIYRNHTVICYHERSTAILSSNRYC